MIGGSPSQKGGGLEKDTSEWERFVIHMGTSPGMGAAQIGG